MWEKIKNILYRNLNMSFGLSGQNAILKFGDLETTGEWSCLQILTSEAYFSFTIDGVSIADSSEYLPAAGNYIGLIIYGKITSCEILGGDTSVRLYAGTNLGL